MANIQINEVSQNYTFNISNSSYATVALPIASCWGPGYSPQTDAVDLDSDEDLESIVWSRFHANQEGLESFISTFRGPIANYRLLKDNSYHMAMTLLTAGYDVLVCRINTGSQASNVFKLAPITATAEEGGEDDVTTTPETKDFVIKAKYNGTFGNNLSVALQHNKVYNRWNIIVYIVDTSGIQTAVENLTFVFDIDRSTDTLLHISEIESNFLEFIPDPSLDDNYDIYDTENSEIASALRIRLSGGSDIMKFEKSEGVLEDPEEIIKRAANYAIDRYGKTIDDIENSKPDYITTIESLMTLKEGITVTDATNIAFKEWLYTSAFKVLDTLKDKLAYNPNRIIVPGWDDQDVKSLIDSTELPANFKFVLSPLHVKLMEVAYYSRCATSYLDIPRSLPRKDVYNESEDVNIEGYAQKLARSQSDVVSADVNIGYYTSHSALFAPWGKYIYVGTAKQAIASPSFLALMIDRAMILNQPAQYEWQLPTSRRHNLKIGKLDYNISKKYLDEWQKIDGVGINCITAIPDLGVSIWGNSTLFEVPPATYQALANLSTRKLVNAIEDLAYRCGISITFNYNNDGAYNSFYAGMTPLLDTMINQGAIEDYYLKMSEDINGLDQVNANSVIGKIYLVIDGVINDISIDLIALPPNTDLNEFRS